MIERHTNITVPFNKLRLHASERNSSWKRIFDEFKEQLTEDDIRFYPNPDELTESLSDLYGTDNFLMGYGSDRCIKYFFEAHTNRRVLIPQPAFPMYNVYGRMNKLEVVNIPYKTLNFPIDDLITKITKNDIIVLSNPSSPIGDVISQSDLLRILEFGVPTLIDEAYIEFSDELSMIPYIEKYSNLYVTRTFSKALGSAGVRFGLIFSNKDNIQFLNQYRDMYETSGLTVRWIKTLLNNLDEYRTYVVGVKRNREFISHICEKMGYEVVHSNSNWIHIRGLTNLSDNVIFKTGCSLPNLGNDWIRLQITDNLYDYIDILK